MEPVIPLTIHEQIVSDASMYQHQLNLNGPPASGDIQRFSNLTAEDPIKMIEQLSSENQQLKVSLQEANKAMREAFETVTAHKEHEKKKQKEIDERFTQAKSKIESLKQTVADKDKTIEELQRQLKQVSDGPTKVSTSTDFQVETLNKMLVQANQSSLQFKQKAEQLSQQLTFERSQRTQLISQNEALNKNVMLLKEEVSGLQLKNMRLLKANEDKRADDSQILGNLQSHVNNLQASLKAEKDKNSFMQEQLHQQQLKHEQLLTDYHDLLVESDQKADKQAELLTLKKDYDQRIDNLTAQILVAEDTLTLRDNQITALKQRVKEHDDVLRQIEQQKQEIEMLRFQASVYKTDFEAERKSREELNDQRLQLRDKLDEVEKELAKANLQIMQLRHAYNPAVPHTLPGPGASNHAIFPQLSRGAELPLPFPETEQAGPTSMRMQASISPVTTPSPGNQTLQRPLSSPSIPQRYPEAELECPICHHIAPDIDSLQLHCNDCIQ